MNRIRFVSALMMGLTACFVATRLALSAPRGAESPPGATPSGRASDVEKVLLKLEQKWADAIVNHDRTAIDGIVAEEFVSTDPAGRTWNKEKYLDEIRDTAFDIESRELSHLDVRVYAQAAVVTGLATIRTGTENPGGTGTYRFTDTFIRRHGEWRCVSTHECRVANDPSLGPPVLKDVPYLRRLFRSRDIERRALRDHSWWDERSADLP